MGGIVMKNIIDYLAEDNQLDIITLRQGDDDVESYKGIDIRYVKSFPYYILNTRRKRLNSANGLERFGLGIALGCFRFCSVLLRVLSPLGINAHTTRLLKKEIISALASSDYDHVICNAKPFESFEAVYQVIGMVSSGTRFVAYQTDDFVSAGDERYVPGFIVSRNQKNRIKRLDQYVDKFSSYCMLESVYSKETGCLKDSSRVTKLGIPLLINKQNTSVPRSSSGSHLKFVYAGSLVMSFRPPNECMDILMCVADSKDMTVDVYHRGDCMAVMDEYERSSGGVIRNRGEVSADVSYEAIDSADVLISISNTQGDQISGKTFDYISTCKPVIHFYYAENDMNASVFARYPKGLCIRVTGENNSENAGKILSFLDSVSSVALSYQEIEKEFMEYTVTKVVESLLR